MTEMTWQAWLDQICAAPDEALPKLAAADWCEERMLSMEAECLRFCAEGKRPYLSGGGKGLNWFNGERIQKGLGDEQSDIPEAVYLALEGGEEKANHKKWPSMKEAFLALVKAWKKAREGGWSPDGSA